MSRRSHQFFWFLYRATGLSQEHVFGGWQAVPAKWTAAGLSLPAGRLRSQSRQTTNLHLRCENKQTETRQSYHGVLSRMAATGLLYCPGGWREAPSPCVIGRAGSSVLPPCHGEPLELDLQGRAHSPRDGGGQPLPVPGGGRARDEQPGRAPNPRVFPLLRLRPG